MKIILCIIIVFLFAIALGCSSLLKRKNNKEAHGDKELTELVIGLVRKSRNLDELWFNARKIELPQNGLNALLKMYSSPPEQPANFEQYLKRFGAGKVWEYLWTNSCFALISRYDLGGDLRLFYKLIEEGHMWYSNCSFKVLCYQYLDSKDESIMDNIKTIIDSQNIFGVTAYLDILSLIRNNDTVDKIFEDQIQKQIQLETKSGYINCFYLFKFWYSSNENLKSGNDIILYKIAQSGEENEVGDFEGINFQPKLRARALYFYLKLNPENEEAIKYRDLWLQKETDDEIVKLIKKR